MTSALADTRAFGLAVLQRLHRGSASAYIGWPGHGNLGDDVMFSAAKTLLDRRVLALRGTQVERWLGRFGLSDTAVFDSAFLGGGTLINRDYLSPVRYCLNAGLPLVSLGTGVGSTGLRMEGEAPTGEWPDLLARFNAVGVRGPLSQEKLRRAGFGRAEVTGDLALALTPARPLAEWSSRRFMLNCAPARSGRDMILMRQVASALALATRELAAAGWEPLPVAFHASDRIATEGVLRKAGVPQVPVAVPRCIEDYFAIASRAALSIGVRLHSAVLAAACGVAPVLVCYRDKCRDFAASIDDESMLVQLQGIDGTRLLDAVELAARGGEPLGRRLHADCASWRERIEGFVRRVKPSVGG